MTQWLHIGGELEFGSSQLVRKFVSLVRRIEKWPDCAQALYVVKLALIRVCYTFVFCANAVFC
jgi:hypothetical protein